MRHINEHKAIERAKGLFAKRTDEVIYVTSDNMAFGEALNKQANDHARQNGLYVYTVCKKDLPSDDYDERLRAKKAIEQGLKQGVISQSGSWLKYGEDGLAMGKENTIQYLSNNTDILAKIEDALKSE